MANIFSKRQLGFAADVAFVNVDTLLVVFVGAQNSQIPVDVTCISDAVFSVSQTNIVE
jgi:hypothetical protein